MSIWPAVISGAIGIIGTLLGGWASTRFVRAAAKRKAVLELLDTYVSPDFYAVRAVTSEIRSDWIAGDRSIVDYFVTEGITKSEPRGPNGLPRHQNLSWLLHFFGSLAIYADEKLVDISLLKHVFEPHYLWYRRFFFEFDCEYRRRARPGWPPPFWQLELPRLDQYFANTPRL
jgi:hypothetical protein